MINAKEQKPTTRFGASGQRVFRTFETRSEPARSTIVRQDNEIEKIHQNIREKRSAVAQNSDACRLIMLGSTSCLNMDEHSPKGLSLLWQGNA